MAEHDDVGRSESTQTESSVKNWTDAQLAKAMEDHVRKRGEPNLNGAWAMMLEASARLDRWHGWAERYYERCEEAAPDQYESIRHIEDALDARDAETKRLREALEKYEGRQVRGGKSE